MDSCLINMLNKYETNDIDFELFQLLFPSETKSIFAEFFYTNVGAKKLLKV